MKCATCFALTRMPTPNSSTPGLLLMMVRLRVPRACSALMRFSGRPQRPKPPHMIVAPSGISATASAALCRTLFMDVDYPLLAFLDQFRSPFRGGVEDLLDGVTALEIAPQLREPLNQAVECVADRVGVGQADIAPDIGGTRCEP